MNSSQPPTNQVNIFDLVKMRIDLNELDSEAICDACDHLDILILNFVKSLNQGPTQ
jgi:hypothetical protein